MFSNDSAKHWLIWLMIIGAFGLLAALATWLSPNRPFADQQSTSEPKDVAVFYTADRQLAVEGSPLPWSYEGAINPRVTIVEFLDYTCTHCQASWPVIRRFLSDNAEQVKLIIRDRTPSIHSLNLSLAAHCAGEQGRYWQLHDKLFANQSAELGKTDESILALSDQINLDRTAFSNCMRNRKYLEQIKADMQAADELEVRGTPTWFINGAKVEGELTIERLEEIVRPLLTD